MAAQRNATRVDVIVVNYHILLLDALLKQGGGNGLLPPNDEIYAVILDEAHHLAATARGCFGADLTIGQCYNAVATARRALPVDHRAVNGEILRTFNAMSAYIKSPAYRNRLKVPGAINTETLVQALTAITEEATNEADLQSEQSVIAKLKIIARKCTAAAATLAMVQAVPEQYAIALTPLGEHVAIDAQVVDVSQMLQTLLFSAHRCVISMSATMTAFGSFTFVADQAGMDHGNTDYLTVPSPFDFSTQALLVLPPAGMLPDDPNDKQYIPEMCKLAERVVRLAKGRTLILCTSNYAVDKIAASLTRVPYTVLKQGDLPKSQLLQMFRDDVSSVLVGTTSLWTGVDVPGEALSAVLIDKIPFPMQSDPIVDALADRDPRSWFHGYSLPTAMIAMLQGSGRLIRSIEDRGVLVIADPRMRVKPYGKQILRALPKMRTTNNLSDIAGFLA